MATNSGLHDVGFWPVTNQYEKRACTMGAAPSCNSTMQTCTYMGPIHRPCIRHRPAAQHETRRRASTTKGIPKVLAHSGQWGYRRSVARPNHRTSPACWATRCGEGLCVVANLLTKTWPSYLLHPVLLRRRQGCGQSVRPLKLKIDRAIAHHRKVPRRNRCFPCAPSSNSPGDSPSLGGILSRFGLVVSVGTS